MSNINIAQQLKQYKISINKKIKTGKTTKIKTPSEYSKISKNWENIEVDRNELINYIKEGYTFCAQTKNGNRCCEDILGTNTIFLDFDDTEISPDDFTELSFNKKYCQIIYTTASHTKENPRYRAIYLLENFITSKEEYLKIYKKILKEFKNGDESVKDFARCFYGNYDAEIIRCSGELINNSFYKENVTDILEELDNKKNIVIGKRHNKMLQELAKARSQGKNEEQLIKLSLNLQKTFTEELNNKEVEGIIEWLMKKESHKIKVETDNTLASNAVRNYFEDNTEENIYSENIVDKIYRNYESYRKNRPSEKDIIKEIHFLKEKILNDARYNFCEFNANIKPINFMQFLVANKSESDYVQAIFDHQIWNAKRKILNVKNKEIFPSKHLLVNFYGKQGAGKTTFLNNFKSQITSILCKEMINGVEINKLLNDGTTEILAAKNSFVLFPELRNINKTVVESLKNLITAENTTARAVYKEVESIHNYSVYFSDSNIKLMDVIHDDSGYRRFIDIEINVSKENYNNVNNINFIEYFKTINAYSEDPLKNYYPKLIEKQIKQTSITMFETESVLPENNKECYTPDEIYTAYSIFCKTRKITPENSNSFYQKLNLENMELTKKRTAKGWRYYKISLENTNLHLVKLNK